MVEAYDTKYSMHPGSRKMCHNLNGRFWWNNTKREIVTFVTYQLVKVEHQKPPGFLQSLEILKWK